MGDGGVTEKRTVVVADEDGRECYRLEHDGKGVTIEQIPVFKLNPPPVPLARLLDAVDRLKEVG